MAELATLLLAAKYLSVLQVYSGGIGSDCLMAVTYLQSDVLSSPWKLKPWVSQFQELISPNAFEVVKISRIQNHAAHLLAVKARSLGSQRVPTSVCTKSEHGHPCAVLSALLSVQWGLLSLNHVHCF
ncbi:hypothetical protein SEVIR_5G184750v4 [Setaria viridis]